MLHRDRPLRLSRKSASAASRPRRCTPSTAARRIFTPLQNPLTSLTFDNYSRVLDADGYRQSITNSLIVSGIGAILVAAIAVAAAVVAKRSTFRFSKTIEYLALGAPRYEAAAAREQAALAELRERRPDRAIETNVEFWAAVILDFAEVPTLMMPAMSPAAAPRAGVPTSSSRNVWQAIRPAVIYPHPRPLPRVRRGPGPYRPNA